MRTLNRLSVVLIFTLVNMSLILTSCAPYPSQPVIDQFQPFFNANEDWNFGNGQIFTAGLDGLLIGIKLPTKRFGAPRDLAIEIRKVDSNGLPSDIILARGITLGEKTRKEQMSWRVIYFQKPYHQSKGEKLAWINAETARIQPHGWHNLAFQSNNPYHDGYMYYRGWLHDGDKRTTYEDKEYDMAFATLVIPDFNPFKYWLFSKERPETVLEYLADELD